MDFARDVVLDLDTLTITIGGAEFPWFFTDCTPSLIKDEDGQDVPGLTLTIACADFRMIKPSKALSGG